MKLEMVGHNPVGGCSTYRNDGAEIVSCAKSWGNNNDGPAFYHFRCFKARKVTNQYTALSRVKLNCHKARR